MKRIYAIVLFCTVFSTSIFGQQFDWAVRGGLYAYDYGFGVVTDASGNVFVSGKFEEDAIFSGVTLTCKGNHDMFVAKYDPSGALLWIKAAGGSMGDYAHCIAIDAAGDVYVAGEYETTADFEGTTITAKSDNDIFLAKYTNAGTLVYVVTAGGYLNDKVLGVGTDASGNAYITGQIEGAVTFGNISLTSAGDKDIFIAKYNSIGEVQWAKRAGGPGRDEGKALSVNAAGEIYVTGFFKNTATFEGTTGTTTMSANTTQGQYDDAFLARYDTDGNLIWVRKAGGDYDDDAWSVSANNSGKIFITGEFNGYATFDSKALTVTGIPADIFIACYNSAGDIQWVERAGSTLLDRGRGICSDNANIYLTGQFGGAATFGTTTLTAADSLDIFIASYEANGAFRWAMAVGGEADRDSLGPEAGNAVAVDKAGNVYATGGYLKASTFGTITLAPYTRTDMFLTKISQSGYSGINEDMTNNSFNVYPNPNNGQFTFSFNVSERDDYAMELRNVMGQIIYTEKLTGFSGEYSNVIDVSSFSKGVYNLRIISSKNKSAIKKVTVY